VSGASMDARLVNAALDLALEEVLARDICEPTARALAVRWAVRAIVSSAPTLNHAVAIVCADLAEAASEGIPD